MLIGLYGAPEHCKALAKEMLDYDAYEIYRLDQPIEAMLTQFHIKPDVWDDETRSRATIPWVGKSPNDLKQTLRGAWGYSSVGNDVWLNFAKGRWNHINANNQGRMVISDLRHKADAQWIHDVGGLVIGINEAFHDTSRSNMVDDVIEANSEPKAMYDAFWERIHVLLQ